MPTYRVCMLSERQVRDAKLRIKARSGQWGSLDDFIRETEQIVPEGCTSILHADLGPACFECADVSDLLCDFPVAKGKTCDRALCSNCTPQVALDVHYCKAHRAEFEAFAEAGGVRDKLENLVLFSRNSRRKAR